MTYDVRVKWKTSGQWETLKTVETEEEAEFLERAYYTFLATPDTGPWFDELVIVPAEEE
jgi:hypothetical protein